MYAETQTEMLLALFINPHPHDQCIVFGISQTSREVQFWHLASPPPPPLLRPCPILQALPHKHCWFKYDVHFGSLGLLLSHPTPPLVFCSDTSPDAHRSGYLAGEMVVSTFLLKSEFCHSPLHTSLIGVSLTGL